MGGQKGEPGESEADELGLEADCAEKHDAKKSLKQ